MTQPNAVVDESRSFMKSRIILTAVEMDFFTRLDKSPVTQAKLPEIINSICGPQRGFWTALLRSVCWKIKAELTSLPKRVHSIRLTILKPSARWFCI